MPPLPARALDKGRRVTWTSALLAACLAGCASDAPNKAQLQSWGYASWWLPPDIHDLRDSRFDRLAFFEIELSTNGGIADAHGWPDAYSRLREAAARLRIPLDATLTLRGQQNFESLFGSPEAVERLLATCLALVEEDPYLQGLQLDFEQYDEASPRSLDALRAFVPRLASALHGLSPARKLSVFVPTGGPKLYDADSLAGIDWAVMQAYDAHWITGPDAGPVAPLDGPERVTWTKVWRDARALRLPPERVVMSFPLYGYEWPVLSRDPRGLSAGPAGTTTLALVRAHPLPEMAGNVHERVRQHGCRHDALAGSSNYLYLDPVKGWVSGWYEGAWSLSRKRDFLVRHGLAGIAFFIAGYDDYVLTNRLDRARIARATDPPESAPCN